MKNKLTYLIKSDGLVIAAFYYQSDRDNCLDFLREKYDDCAFSAEERDD